MEKGIQASYVLQILLVLMWVACRDDAAFQPIDACVAGHLSWVCACRKCSLSYLYLAAGWIWKQEGAAACYLANKRNTVNLKVHGIDYPEHKQRSIMSILPRYTDIHTSAAVLSFSSLCHVLDQLWWWILCALQGESYLM